MESLESDLPLKRAIDGIPLGVFAIRVAWVAVQLVLVIYLGRQGAIFFYQAF
jgi:hypothetical protein